MNSFPNKKLSQDSFRVTPQEQYLKYLFNSEAIPFVSQQAFPLPDRSYIVDFFIADRLLLECTQTSAHAYQVALRQKAVHLEAKSLVLKRAYEYPIWVLFESLHPISSQLVSRLVRLMPSVDRIFTDPFRLLESLQHFCRDLSEGSL